MTELSDSRGLFEQQKINLDLKVKQNEPSAMIQHARRVPTGAGTPTRLLGAAELPRLNPVIIRGSIW